jgi:hypothetical protein
VVVVDVDAYAPGWTRGHRRISAVTGDAGDEATTARAADVAETAAPLAGWVNNAAIFRDATLHVNGAPAVPNATKRQDAGLGCPSP